MRTRVELLLVSILVLFLELACIRWFPAHVLFLTFFTNTVLLASFLGMSVGCLAANRPRNFIKATHAFLALAVLAALVVEYIHFKKDTIVLSAGGSSQQVVFFGSDQPKPDVAAFVIPVEV